LAELFEPNRIKIEFRIRNKFEFHYTLYFFNKLKKNRSTDENLTALQLAVKRHLPLVVENLCKRGANMSILDSEGNSPLWTALDTGQEDIASILVANKCDTTQWSTGPENCLQSLLHRAIDENNEAVAVFLIKRYFLIISNY
jgi:ankyrin repeat protein